MEIYDIICKFENTAIQYLFDIIVKNHSFGTEGKYYRYTIYDTYINLSIFSGDDRQLWEIYLYDSEGVKIFNYNDLLGEKHVLLKRKDILGYMKYLNRKLIINSL